MTHDEWVKQQGAEALTIANGIRSGAVGVIEGSRRLAALRRAVESPRLEELLTPFAAIESETDHLPVGEHQRLWAAEVLVEKRAELAAAEASHRADALVACANLIETLEQDV